METETIPEQIRTNKATAKPLSLLVFSLDFPVTFSQVTIPPSHCLAAFHNFLY